MTSAISSSVSSRYQSPLARLQSELASQVSLGTIGAGDQPALGSALTDIDSTLKSQAPSRGAPGDVKSKIDDLIAGAVKDGKLTSAQVDELKGIFASTFQGAPQGAGGSGGGGHGGPGGPGGAGGPPPGGGGAAGASGSGSSSDSTDPADLNGDGTVTAAEQAEYDATHPAEATTPNNAGSSSSSTTSSTSGSDTSQLLADFLKSLQESQGGSSGYSASGSNVASQIESRLFDYLV